MITINLQVKAESPATRVNLGELPSSHPGKLPTGGATSGQHLAWWSHILLLILYSDSDLS